MTNRSYFLFVVLGTCLILLAAPGPRAVAAPSKAAAYYYFLLGSLEKASGRGDTAYEAFQRALEQDPGAADLLRELTITAFQRGELDQAQFYAEQALTVHPDSVELKLTLAKIYARNKLTGKAITLLEEAARSVPDDPEPLFLLGTLYIQVGMETSAVSSFTKAASLMGKKAFLAYYYLGKIHLDKKDYPQAAHFFQKAIDGNPHLITAYFDLAEAYDGMGQKEKAESVITRVLEKDPANLRALEYRLKSLYKKGDLQGVAKVTGRLTALAQEDPRKSLHVAEALLATSMFQPAIDFIDAVTSKNEGSELLGKEVTSRLAFYKAIAYESMNRFKVAMEVFSKVPIDSKVGLMALLRRAYLLSEHGQVREAVKLLEGARGRFDGNKEWILALSSLYEELQRWDESLVLLRSLAKKEPDDKKIGIRLAMALDRSGNRKEAVALAERLLKIYPDEVIMLNFLGYTYAEEGIRLKEAEQMIKKALAKSPGDGYIIDSLGWVYFKQGRLDEAIANLTRAIELAPKDSIIAEHLGDAYFAKKAFYNSIKAYRKALRATDDPGAKSRLLKKISRSQGMIFE